MKVLAAIFITFLVAVLITGAVWFLLIIINLVAPLAFYALD